MGVKIENNTMTTTNKNDDQSASLKPSCNSISQRWLAACAHELRIPIAQIDAAMMILTADNEERYLTPKERQCFLRDVVAANESLNLLVEDCIAFAKGTQADFPVTLASVDLLSLLKQVHHSFVNQMSENVDLVFDYPSNIPTHVIGDAQRITQCVANLIRNAVKFTEKGCITIRVNLLNQQYLKIEVIDTGIGIPGNKIHAIWDAFTKVHDAEQDNVMGRHKGLGLGLAIVSQFVQQMHGQVDVESQPGAGSSFSFTLPIDG